MLYLLIRSFFPLKENHLWKGLVLIGFVSVMTTPSYSNERLTVIMLLFVLFSLAVVLSFEGTFVQKISVAVILYPVVQGSSYLFYDLGFQLWLLLNGNPVTDSFLHIASFLLKFLFWVLIYKLFKNRIRNSSTFLNHRMWLIMVLISLASFISLQSLILFAPQQAVLIYPACLACILTSLGIIYLIGYMADTVKIDLENQQLKLQETYYEELADNQLEIRKIRHDMNHHLSVIGVLIEAGDFKQTQDYFDQLSLQLSSYGKEFCENSLVNAVINSKYSKFQEHHVDTFLNISIDDAPAIDDISLCTIFANTMENALEAVLTIENPEERKMKIQARYQNGYFSYKITNNKGNDIRETKDGLITTKENKKAHGYGLKIVESVVNKYNGTFDISHNENEFSLVILIGNI
ncbi:GHKL domain-containing protein [Vagococcus elongatus]|uniref:Sensor histidine kinase NatK-like C-terminal domain-containing protein n=1 Tax=Vagococcus elongatus TaxID=180344 RepID=A0A430AN07_9ENTE|nr:sensor histidine kinase [Vagococcus elongatus]RSU09456.1 hypothetical protein CBF29_11445 [Vagococcus elongatus]